MCILTMDELVSVLRATETEQQRAGILLAYWHGLCVSEIIALTEANFRGGEIEVRRSRGSRTTRHPVILHHEELLDEATPVNKMLKLLKPGEKLFDVSRFVFYRWFKRAAQKAGLPKEKQHPQILKRSIGVAAILKVGPASTQEWLGLKSKSSVNALKEKP